MTRTTSSARTKKRTKKRKKRSSSSSSPPTAGRRVLLGLGSNLGGRRARLVSAVKELQRLSRELRVSSVYETDPVGYADQPHFWNLAAEIRWTLGPEDLLEALARIERRVGRRQRFRNGPREIDIDILDFGGAVRDSPDPVLPHPRLASRRFALTPLAEIAPRWRHPVTGLTARQMMRALPAKPGVRRIGPLEETGKRAATYRSSSAARAAEGRDMRGVRPPQPAAPTNED